MTHPWGLPTQSNTHLDNFPVLSFRVACSSRAIERVSTYLCQASVVNCVKHALCVLCVYVCLKWVHAVFCVYVCVRACEDQDLLILVCQYL